MIMNSFAIDSVHCANCMKLAIAIERNANANQVYKYVFDFWKSPLRNGTHAYAQRAALGLLICERFALIAIAIVV